MHQHTENESSLFSLLSSILSSSSLSSLLLSLSVSVRCGGRVVVVCGVCGSDDSGHGVSSQARA